MQTYKERVQALTHAIQSSNGEIGLQKDTSNLFRDRKESQKFKIDVRHFHHVLSVNTKDHWVDVEGMTTYEELVNETLRYGELPAVVPQLKTITIGGAVSGAGIESSSFKYGLVHETILEMDVLLPSGDVVTATAVNEFSDLFYALPNSYGTLGYIVRVRAKTVPAKKYVHLQYTHFSDPAAFFMAMKEACAGTSDFVDGVIFNGSSMTLMTGALTNNAPYTSDYTWMKIFYRSIPSRTGDYLTAKDFIWRWDTDWFWCSKNLHMQNPISRLLMGRRRLNSRTYNAIMRWSNKHKIGERINRLTGTHSESVIQDICIPVDRSEEFLSFLLKDIGILPIWICPSKSPDPKNHFTLFPMHNELMLDFGFWDFVKTDKQFSAGYFNTLVEKKTMELRGIKSLYSSSYFDRETFWNIYNGVAYGKIKKKYDPAGRLKNLYEKCVLKQ